jgi:hypothetical protein
MDDDHNALASSNMQLLSSRSIYQGIRTNRAGLYAGDIDFPPNVQLFLTLIATAWCWRGGNERMDL